jgi:hypothetical protein
VALSLALVSSPLSTSPAQGAI